MAEVFISYRHDDSEGWAGRLAEAIQIAFGETEVFFDMESIIPSAEWRRSIEEALTSCKVLIALIGPRWVSAAAPAGQRRLDNPQDVVRYEIASALHHGIPLLPVLVGGRHFLSPPNCRRNCRECSHTKHWSYPPDAGSAISNWSWLQWKKHWADRKSIPHP